MSEIFDIPTDDKPKKEKKQMSPEAKEKLLERLRAGRERAKLKREEQAKLKKEEPVVETPVVETPVVEVQPDTEPETTDDNNLDDEDVRVLASQIEELENKVNQKQKRQYKKRDGTMINKAKVAREKYIADTVAKQVAEQMSKINTPKPSTSTPQNKNPVSQPPKHAVVQTPVQTPVKKPSKFAGKIKPLWARGLDV
jgi:hypothetical protein